MELFLLIQNFGMVRSIHILEREVLNVSVQDFSRVNKNRSATINPTGLYRKQEI